MESKNFEKYTEFAEINPEKLNLHKEFDAIRQFHDTYPEKKADFGYKLNEVLKQELRRQYKNKLISTNEGINRIDSIYSFYRNIIGDIEAVIVKNGALAEFSTEKSFSIDTGFATYPGTETDDKIHKIDSWVWLDPDPNTLGIQVKCISGVKELNFIDLEDKDQLKELYNKYGHLLSRIKGLEEKIMIQREYCKSEREKDIAITPILLVLPSPESPYSLFNAKNGLPGEEMRNLLLEKGKKYLKEEVLA